jgi:hypothetical protein
MIGSVRLKSKSCAFSIASAIDGGAKAAIKAKDLAVAEESKRAWRAMMFSSPSSKIRSRAALRP